MSEKRLKWRTGTKVPRNLYRGDEPIAMLATAELGKEIADSLNSAATLRSERDAAVKLVEEAANKFTQHQDFNCVDGHCFCGFLDWCEQATELRKRLEAGNE